MQLNVNFARIENIFIAKCNIVKAYIKLSARIERPREAHTCTSTPGRFKTESTV